MRFLGTPSHFRGQGSECEIFVTAVRVRTRTFRLHSLLANTILCSVLIMHIVIIYVANDATSASIAELCVDAFAGETNGPAHCTLSSLFELSFAHIESALLSKKDA